MNPREAADRLRELPAALLEALTAAEERTQRDALALAQRFSSGTVSRKQQRKMGHPYAKRRGTPLLTPWIINDQGGLFAKSWRAPEPEFDGQTLRTRVENDSPEAAFLDATGGTVTMLARPLADHVEALVEPARERRIREAFEAALK